MFCYITSGHHIMKIERNGILEAAQKRSMTSSTQNARVHNATHQNRHPHYKDQRYCLDTCSASRTHSTSTKYVARNSTHPRSARPQQTPRASSSSSSAFSPFASLHLSFLPTILLFSSLCYSPLCHLRLSHFSAFC